MDEPANEMAAPLNSATYSSTQAGHLGSKTSVALGLIHPTTYEPPPEVVWKRI